MLRFAVLLVFLHYAAFRSRYGLHNKKTPGRDVRVKINIYTDIRPSNIRNV